MGGVGEVLALDHGAAVLLEARGEGVGNAFTVGLGVGGHADLGDLQGVVEVVGVGRALKVVGRGDPEVIVGPSRPQILGERHAGRLAVHIRQTGQGHRDVDVLGQALVGVCRADLDQVGPIRDRHLGPGDAGVEGPDHAEYLAVVDELLDVLGALLRIVDAVHRVVEVEDLQGESVN